MITEQRSTSTAKDNACREREAAVHILHVPHRLSPSHPFTIPSSGKFTQLQLVIGYYLYRTRTVSRHRTRSENIKAIYFNGQRYCLGGEAAVHTGNVKPPLILTYPFTVPSSILRPETQCNLAHANGHRNTSSSLYCHLNYTCIYVPSLPTVNTQIEVNKILVYK